MCEIPPVVWAVEANRYGVKEIEPPFYFAREDAERVAAEKNEDPLNWRRRVVPIDVK